MKDFVLQYPESVADAVALLPEGARGWVAADARLMAGGQDLLGELKEHLLEPERVVNLQRVEALRAFGVSPSGDARLGALTTVAELASSPILRANFAGLCEAAADVASPQIRSRATLGGNLCQRPRCWYYRNEATVCLKKGGTECFSYDGMNKFNAILGGGPSYIVHPSDLAPALIALDARVQLSGPEGDRELALEDFYTLPTEGDVTRESVLRSDELLVRVELPERRGWKSTYLKFQEKESFDWALSAVAIAVRMQAERVAEARVVLGGVAPRPWRCHSTEALLVGRALDDDTGRLAAEEALVGAEPLSQNEYKIPLTKALVRRALRKLAEA